MDLSFFHGFFGRALERKKTLIFLSALVLLFTILGMCLLKSVAVYEYHLNLCETFLLDICYSDTNVFLIFLERLGGCALLLLLILLGGMHPIALLLPLAVLVYRAFTFGGSILVFFDYYGMTGALVVFVLYLPVHFAIDILFVFAATLSFGRAFHFCFYARDLLELFKDLFILLIFAAAVYLFEALLLLALFHPIGKIL